MAVVRLYKLVASGPNGIRHGAFQPSKIFVLLPINRVRSKFTYFYLRNRNEPDPLNIETCSVFIYSMYGMNANNTVQFK